MNDRLPGSSYFNPIWYGKWRIYIDSDTWPPFAYAYVHDDYDGAEDACDNRYGYAATIEQAKSEIDEQENNA